ncbi:nuclear transport factor 2 family protein [Baekduia sp. Peel2402]|uniref:nuclear transport factor 2 family protein n=1 Tax=Baekduia sp. Peel2402 TaxID=3458296 RepID=UPI00403E92BD
MSTPERQTLLQEMYAAFNARDADAVLVRMTPEVEWPKAFEGGAVKGREAVKEYWARQWSEIDPHVEPVGFGPGDDGRVVVTVAQTVRSLDGAVIAEGEVLHVYAFDEATGLISAMEIAEAA